MKIDRIKLNPNINTVDLNDLLEKQQVIVIDDFYENIDWLEDERILKRTKLEKSEQVFYIEKNTRLKLLEDVSKLLPDLYYPSDSGWIRSNIVSTSEIPEATALHCDNPYIVVSVCLSDPPMPDNEEKFGTRFYKHKDFEFKKVNGHEKSDLYLKLFNVQKSIPDMWEEWFTFSFKKNRAIIYDGSLIHKMPWPMFGTCFEDSRKMQIFNFRMKSK